MFTLTPEEARAKAEQNFLDGCNCSQAVLKVFAECMNADTDLLLRTSQPLGGGLCRQREICGTLSGLLMSLGLFEGSADTSDKNAKDILYADGQLLTKTFREHNGSIICRELLGLKKGENDSPLSTPRTADFYTKRPCKALCGEAAAILAEFLLEKQSLSFKSEDPVQQKNL